MLRLEMGQSSLVVMPESGGAILGWMNDRTHVLRHALPDAVITGNVRGMGCFPLVPFCNRIAYGRFTWQGVRYQIERNFGDHPHAIHGVGWQRRWQVENASDTSAAFTLQHDATGEHARQWPFSFLARLSYLALPRKLVVELTLTNLHSGPAPVGIGLHPYFPRRSGATLQFEAGGVWINGWDSLPSQHTKVPREWDHGTARPVGSVRLDNCFTAWNRRAQIAGIAGGITIEAQNAFRHLQVYTPSGEDYFCVEPVSHVPDAINRPALPTDQGMHVLEPGEILSGSVTIALPDAFRDLSRNRR